MITKICPKCATPKDRDHDFFKRSGKNSHLPRSYCKECERKDRKVYDIAHPEKVKQWDKNGLMRALNYLRENT